MIFIFNDQKTGGKLDHFVLLFQGTKEQAEKYIIDCAIKDPARFPYSYICHAVPPQSPLVFARHKVDESSMPEVGDAAEEKDDDDLGGIEVTPA